MIAALTAANAAGIVLVALVLAVGGPLALLAFLSLGRPDADDRCPWCDSPPNPAGADHAAGCTRPVPHGV